MKKEVETPKNIIPFYIINSSDTLIQIEYKIEKFSSDSTLDNEIINDSDEFPEGKELTRIHKSKERNPAAIKKKKLQVLKQTGKLVCEVCGFDFAEKYGEYGLGFAECHHKIPVHQLSINHKTSLSDLSIICANCHRILHRTRPKLLSIEELKEIIQP